MTVLQELYSALKIALVLVEAARLRRFNKPSLQAQDELPAAARGVNVLFDVVKELDKAHLARHVRRVVVECGPVEERVFAVPRGSNELVDACEALFSLDAALHLPFVTLFVPDLESLIKLAHKVRSNLVIDHAIEPTTAILGRVSYIHPGLPRLWIVGHTRRCHLICFELHTEELFKAQIFVVVIEDLDGIVTSDNISLRLQVCRL